MNAGRERRPLIERVRSALRREGLERVQVVREYEGQVTLSTVGEKDVTESDRAVAVAIALTSMGVLKVRFESR